MNEIFCWNSSGLSFIIIIFIRHSPLASDPPDTATAAKAISVWAQPEPVDKIQSKIITIKAKDGSRRSRENIFDGKTFFALRNKFLFSKLFPKFRSFIAFLSLHVFSSSIFVNFFFYARIYLGRESFTNLRHSLFIWSLPVSDIFAAEGNSLAAFVLSASSTIICRLSSFASLALLITIK